MSHGRHLLFTIQERVETDPSAAMGDLPELLSYFHQQSLKEQLFASQILVNLAKERPEHPELLRAVDDIVALLDNQDERMLVNLSATIGHVAVVEPTTLAEFERSGRARIVREMERLLMVEHPLVTANAAEILARLAQVRPELVERTPSASGFGLLFTKQDAHRQYALAICDQVAKINPDEVQPYLHHLTDRLRLDERRMEQGVVLAILGQLAAETPDLIIQEADVIKQAAKTDTAVVRGNALAVAAILAKYHPDKLRDLRGIAAKSLTANEDAVRANAAELLYLLARTAPDEIGHPDIRRRLNRAKEDPTESVRQFASLALKAAEGSQHSPTSLEGIAQELLGGDGVQKFLQDVEGIVQPIFQVNDIEGYTDARQDISVTDSDISGDVRNNREPRVGHRDEHQLDIDEGDEQDRDGQTGSRSDRRR